MAHFSAVIARGLELDAKTQQLILEAAPMHDVGKIGIPDYILLKPGKLTHEEFEVMKNHASLGYELLKNSGSEILQAGAEIALSHHEKYDGNGYPKGLVGTKIPLFTLTTSTGENADSNRTPSFSFSTPDRASTERC